MMDAIAPDGSVFVVNTEQHNILKFGNNGSLVKKFGTQGQGDGELYYPNSLSILDGKYLVVGDLPQNCKFTIYDLNGTFKRVVKTGKTAYSPLALTGDKVAYLYKKRHYSRSGDEVEKGIIVFIKDIDTGKEIDVVSYFVLDVGIIHIPGKVRMLIDAFFKGDVFIARAKGGNLLVGLSSSPAIDIYSPGSVKMGPFGYLIMKSCRFLAKYFCASLETV